MRPKLNAATTNLVQQLRKLPKGKSHVDIVSSELCDDALHRLASTLKRHRHCDIIDINPGAALWSSKIHECLQPRNHILVEPLKEHYEPFHRPLLNASGSRYKVVNFGDGERYQLSTYAQDGLLPDQKKLELGDSRIKEPNDSLLILANLAAYGRHKLRSNTSRGYNSHYRILEFVNSVKNHIGFHSHGVARLLLWVTEDEKLSAIPKAIDHRRKLALQIDLAGSIEEIVGAPEKLGASRRDGSIDVESAEKAFHRMKEHNIVIPQRRRDELVQKIYSIMESPCGYSFTDFDALSSSISVGRSWHQELDDLERQFKEGAFPQYVGGTPGAPERDRRFPQTLGQKDNLTVYENTPQYERMRRLRTAKNRNKKRSAIFDQLLGIVGEIDDLEYSVALNNLDPTHLKLKTNEIVRLTKDLENKMSKLNGAMYKEMPYQEDSRKAFRHNPPLLQWDQRSAEPIMANQNEFWPERNLTLLDIQPLPEKIPPFNSSQHQTLENLLSVLFCNNSQSIITGLSSIGPGTVDYIVSRVPALTDPRKGGRLDLNRLRVRMLTLEMLKDMAVAFDCWPQKPSMSSFNADLVGEEL